MRVRTKDKPNLEFYSDKFNTHALGEVEGCSVDFGIDLFFIKDLDVFIEALREWKDMRQAFKDKDLISDNYNIYFFEPENDEERKKGYRL